MVDLKIKLPDSFFQEEERDGCVVSAELKKLWAVQLDLLCEFDRVCRKHGLKYVLDFGTLLGAVRHKGYIPWDDDLDVSMLREDYDRLMEIGPKEFKEPYFLQSQTTDKYYDDYVTKLRRSDTCYMTDNSKSSGDKYNQGIFIDIFVFDNVASVDKDDLQQMSKDSTEAYYHMYVMSHTPKLEADGIKWPVKMLRYLYFKLRYGSVRKEYLRLERYAKSCGPTGNVGTVMYAYPHCRPLSVYDEIIEIPYENMMMPVPGGYDEVLRLRYGDYMTPVRGGSWHTMATFDTDRSYKDIVKEMKK